MQRDDGVYVGHMLDISRKVASKIAGVRREKFDEDENLRLALAHLLQPIGEAARRISREFQEAHPEIPWGESSGCGTRSFTTTWDVDEDVVWKTSVEEIPARGRARAARPELTPPTHGRATKPSEKVTIAPPQPVS